MNLSRQRDLVPPGTIDEMRFVLIGAGGLGSNLFHTLISLGAREIKIFDHDRVEEENLAPGWFFHESLGLYKPDALLAQAQWTFNDDFPGIVPVAQKYSDQIIDPDILFITVDSIVVRRTIWENRTFTPKWWIDGRMGWDQCSAWCIDPSNPEDCDWYEKNLEGRDEPMPCGEKATAFLTKGIAQGFLGTMLYRIANKWPVPHNLFWKAGPINTRVIEAAPGPIFGMEQGTAKCMQP